MTNENRLSILKLDLEILNTDYDSYLSDLLGLSNASLERMGIDTTDTSVDVDHAIIHYAAYLFRKRNSENPVPPRFLTLEINNLLLSQKARQEQ